ncbi:MAG: hypothetical protein ACRC5M_05650 [Anaeroplasmataceae bacterium]
MISKQDLQKTSTKYIFIKNSTICILSFLLVQVICLYAYIKYNSVTAVIVWVVYFTITLAIDSFNKNRLREELTLSNSF